MPFPWQRACIWIKGILIAWFWVTMTKIGKFQQNRWLCVAQLFKWLQRIALNIFVIEGLKNVCNFSQISWVFFAYFIYTVIKGTHKICCFCAWIENIKEKCKGVPFDIIAFVFLIVVSTAQQGGGVLSFFLYTQARTQHIHLPRTPKNIRNFKHPKKIFEFLAIPKNTPILYLDLKKRP